MAEFIEDGVVCRVSGRLSQVEVVRLWRERDTLMSKNIQVIDLSALSYSDSAGVAFLLELLSLAKAENRKLVLTSPSTQLLKLIGLYDLELFFSEEALQGK
ncbi:STAS domain-containing protein [Shewanella canadensis]|uniref:STAS domain-containing protein n=1 Tax=Shewanella canadensis TaxID=271096 RepID=A0A431WYX7_9GAMM|nr:STAS domain-containing protein [Shewanella canadensis]RTR40640.1 STAS domain-containing protein [Shewanella canadensis]